nr:putative E3 ubiquitin-protein ligase LIN [Tanacetum cinerariifolium]
MISKSLLKEIDNFNKVGSYIGVVVPNGFEMNPLLQSSSFVTSEKRPYVDVSGKQIHTRYMNRQLECTKKVSDWNYRESKGYCRHDRIKHGITTQLLLSLFNVKGVLHFGIAGNANTELEIGDVTIPKFWAHTGLWLWQEIDNFNKVGSYIGVVVPNGFEMNPLLQSSSFVTSEKRPYVDVSGRRFRIGTIENQRVIVVMTGLSMLNAGITTQLLLSLFNVKGVLHFGIAGNANTELEIGDVTIPKFWAHTGLWLWQRNGEGRENELPLESNGDYTRSIGYLKFSDYNNDTTTQNKECYKDNLLNRVWYQPEEVFPINTTPETRQHAFWVPVDKHYYALAKKLEAPHQKKLEHLLYIRKEIRNRNKKFTFISESQIADGKHAPPKDFVCPITTCIFNDPVTLETGQTYEREAIQEWIDKGNLTCPITHQKLDNVQLPKTNYVLKRLIASWKELTPGNEFHSPENTHALDHIPKLVSPNSVISRATTDGTVNELRLVITDLCTSQILKKSELAVLKIERFWQEAKMELEIQTMLSKPPVINGFVEILFNSVDTRVLKATVFLLCEVGSRDSNVITTLTRVYSDVECIIDLFKKGLFEAVVLIYLLKPSISTFLELDMADSLLSVVQKREDEFLKMCMRPKAASMMLLAQITENDNDGVVLEVIKSIVSSKAMESIIKSFESESTEERIAAMKILLRCIQEDGKCRNVVADKAELALVLECFLEANDQDRFDIVQFLSELVRLNRRTFNDQILNIIKDEGTFSTMHTLLIYLETALMDQSPIIAGLLLQLDLVVEPRKMSIYREEAIDHLISCLKNSDSPAAQIAAADTLLVLQGRFSYSGKPLVRRFLLKRAGVEKNYRFTTRSGDVQETMVCFKLFIFLLLFLN